MTQFFKSNTDNTPLTSEHISTKRDPEIRPNHNFEYVSLKMEFWIRYSLMGNP